jgi:hypothetical protein
MLDGVELDLLQINSLPREASTIDRIRSANRHFLEAVRDNAGIISVIQQVVSFDPDARAMRDQREEAFANILERRTRELQAAGRADPRLEPRIAARALGGMVNAFANYLYLTEAGKNFDHDIDDVIAQLTLLWSNALGLESERPEPHDAPSDRS